MKIERIHINLLSKLFPGVTVLLSLMQMIIHINITHILTHRLFAPTQIKLFSQTSIICQGGHLFWPTHVPVANCMEKKTGEKSQHQNIRVNSSVTNNAGSRAFCYHGLFTRVNQIQTMYQVHGKAIGFLQSFFDFPFITLKLVHTFNSYFFFEKQL